MFIYVTHFLYQETANFNYRVRPADMDGPIMSNCEPKNVGPWDPPPPPQEND